MDIFSKTVIGLIAGLMHAVAFYIYYRQTLKNISNPNEATWILWFVISLFNCLTYFDMNRDITLTFLPAISTASCMVTAFAFFYKGSLSKLDFLDNIALVIGLIAAFVWFRYQSAEYSNLIIQPSIVISFIPTYRGVIKGNTEKNSLPWIIWSAAYVVQIILVFLTWDGNSLRFVYPINCLILHLGVGIVAMVKNPERRFSKCQKN